MATTALIIGIDAYPAASGFLPCTTAVHDARMLARWLIAQELVSPDQMYLCCAPHDPQAGEYPATAAQIQQALQAIAHAGRAATAEDRCYFFYAGHGLGATPDQLLLLPQDVSADAPGEGALPWAMLERWLATTGFLNQFCFLDPTWITDERWQAAFLAARLPVQTPPSALVPVTRAQVNYYATYATGVQPGTDVNTPASHFGQTLLAGLAGAASRIHATDLRTGERVISAESLRLYLEREVPAQSEGQQRCIVNGRLRDDPILAHLGPVPISAVDVRIEPAAVADVAQVEVACESLDLPTETLTAPPFHLTLLQGLSYTFSVRAPQYAATEEYYQVTARSQTVTLPLIPLVLSPLGSSRRGCQLQITLTEPVLPVTLYNEAYAPLKLPKPTARGGIRKQCSAGHYYLALDIPAGPVSHPLKIQPGQTEAAITLAPPTNPAPLDHLLQDVANRKRLPIPAERRHAGLLILTDNPAHNVTPQLLRHTTGTFLFAPEALSPFPLPVQATLAASAFVRGIYSTQPGLGQLLLAWSDAQRFQLVFPLIAGRTTIVSITTTTAGQPAIELLLVPTELRRPDIAVQRRILWGQRFLRANRWDRVRDILDDPEAAAEPLALALAGYAWLNVRKSERARTYGERLQQTAPEMDDGLLLAEFAGASTISTNVDTLRLPLLSFVLLQSIQLQQERMPSPAASAAQRRNPQANRMHLYRLLTERFSEGELKTLCFCAKIQYDNLPGDGKEDKVRELILYCERHSNLGELVACGKDVRPDITWEFDPQADQRDAWGQFVARLVPEEPWLLLRGDADLSLLFRV